VLQLRCVSTIRERAVFGPKRQVTISLPNPLILIPNIYRMPPQRTRDRTSTPTPSALFFAPRPHREGLIPHNYNNIKRNEVIPSNTLRPAVPPIILFPGVNPTASPPANEPLLAVMNTRIPMTKILLLLMFPNPNLRIPE
jgi:hypothetical protein